MMNDTQLATYYREAYGLDPAETYDPDTHFDVPAMAFGPLSPTNRLWEPQEEGQHAIYGTLGGSSDWTKDPQ